MLQITLQRFFRYYQEKNRWWIPLVAGVPFSFCLLPFNHDIHWLLSPFPFLSFIALLPLFFFSLQPSKKRALQHTYLFSYPIALGQCFWLVFVTIEGLWILIVAGMVLLAGYVALFFLAAGITYRWCRRAHPRFSLLLFPVLWVLIEYSRTLTENSFPWGFLGYNLTPLLPLSQAASVTGVWGLSFIIVTGNLLVLEIVSAWYRKRRQSLNMVRAGIFCVLLGSVAIWGKARMSEIPSGPTVSVSLLQTALNQLNWESNSLDTAFAVTESLYVRAAAQKPDLIVGPESALPCFLSRQRNYRNRVRQWVSSSGIPLILGALHWEKPHEEGSPYDYYVFNTSFLIRPGQERLEPYRKIKLVPFSEALPFEGLFPILSRVNLGESDFHRGRDATVYSVNDSIKAAPFICYESIYPEFVQRRLGAGANLIVQITNDGWFGKTTGPYQHATMARMRVIENGVSMARCALTGICTLVDPFGRVLGSTALGERTILSGNLPLQPASTFYARHGDWFVFLCGMVGVLAFVTDLALRITKKRRLPGKGKPYSGTGE